MGRTRPGDGLVSVEIARVDDWISHLAFSAPRPSTFGQVDGLFWGLLSVVGDATGGAVAVDGDLSEARKTDWVHILGGYSHRLVSGAAVPDGYVEFQTGPKIVGNAAGIDRPTFTAIGPFIRMNSSADQMAAQSLVSGAQPFLGMPLYADPALAGVYEMVHASVNANVDTALYTFSIWGFLVRYQSFFRGVPPALA